MKENFRLGTIYKLNVEVFDTLLHFSRKGDNTYLPYYISIVKIGYVNLHFEEYYEDFNKMGFTKKLNFSMEFFTSMLKRYPILIKEISKNDLLNDLINNISKHVDTFNYPSIRSLRSIEELLNDVNLTNSIEDILIKIKSKISLTKNSIEEWDYFLSVFGINNIDIEKYTFQKAKILLFQ